MPRQSISLTQPNGEWLKVKVEVEGEYSSNSEVINDLIRRARENEKAEQAALRSALIEGEKSGISNKSLTDIVNSVKEKHELP
jgi:antitoxin ParD1/3/4